MRAVSGVWAISACALILGAACAANAESIVVKPTGVGDQSAVIQRALDRCAAKGGGTVLLKSGRYRLDKSLVTPSGVTLAGEWPGPHHAQLDRGTILLAYAGKGDADGAPLVKLQPSSALKGVTVYYPEQTLPNVIAYPWTVQAAGTHCSVLDTTLVNAYRGIDFGSFPSDNHLARNVFGCVLKTGLFVDQCAGGGRIEDVHFNHHYWTRAVNAPQEFWAPLFSYSYLNVSAFEIGGANNEYMANTFTIACKIGYRFFAGKTGACSGRMLNIDADYSQLPLLIEQAGAPGIRITNGQYVAGDATHDESTVTVTPTNTGIVALSNCAFWGPAHKIADISGDGSVSFAQCNFVRFAWEQQTNPVIALRGGELSVQGCVFHEKWDQILIDPGARSASLIGNVFRAPMTVDNPGGVAVQMIGNVTRRAE